MALATTTLSGAITATANSLVVASATSMAKGRFLRIDDEVMQVTKAYVAASTTVPVLRGVGGTAAAAHVTSASITHGDAADFTAPAVSAFATYQNIRPRRVVSYTGATNTFVLPAAGEDVHVILNGTTADTITFPVPTKDLTGCRMVVSSNAVAQHVLTFTGGFSGAGSNYDVITINATAPASFEFAAVEGLWHMLVQPSGTLTNIAGVLS
jgi:hypothetical protein